MAILSPSHPDQGTGRPEGPTGLVPTGEAGLAGRLRTHRRPWTGRWFLFLCPSWLGVPRGRGEGALEGGAVQGRSDPRGPSEAVGGASCAACGLCSPGGPSSALLSSSLP